MMLPAPPINPEDKPYWEAAEQGRLLIKSCRNCGQRHHYPRCYCPFCSSSEVEWLACSGEGTIYSFALLRSRGDVVFAPAYVTLAEGPTLLTGLVSESLEAVSIGDRVRVEFQPSDGGPPLPFFRPVNPSRSAP